MKKERFTSNAIYLKKKKYLMITTEPKEDAFQNNKQIIKIKKNRRHKNLYMCHIINVKSKTKP